MCIKESLSVDIDKCKINPGVFTGSQTEVTTCSARTADKYLLCGCEENRCRCVGVIYFEAVNKQK